MISLTLFNTLSPPIPLRGKRELGDFVEGTWVRLRDTNDIGEITWVFGENCGVQLTSGGRAIYTNINKLTLI